MSDTSYIIKRVIIGILIALGIMAFKSFFFISVSAKEMTTSSFGGLQVAVNGTDNNYIWDVTDGSWEDWGSGVLIGNGSIIKTNGQSTSSFATVRSVMAYSGNQAYVCRMGSTASNNSTYQNQTFTFECPMIMGQYGLQQIAFIYSHTGGTDFTMRLEVNGSMTFIKDDDTSGSSTTSAINNQITNDNTNTTNIINNNNQNTQDIIQSNQVCSVFDTSSITLDNNYLNAGGSIGSTPNSNYGIVQYVYITPADTLSVLNARSDIVGAYYCFYNTNKSYISCSTTQNNSDGDSITIPSNASYVSFTIDKARDKPQFKLCRNGNQAIADGQQQLNDTLNNDNIDSNTGVDFFDDFDFGDDTLASVITAPLRFFNKLTDVCSPLTISVFNQSIILPCGDTVVWDKQEFSSFRTWWNLFFGGIAIYTLGLKLFKVVHDAIDPEKDNIESVGV